MNLFAIKALRDKAVEVEAFWFAAHRDAEDEADLNDFGSLYVQAREIRQKLDEIIERRDADEGKCG